MKVGPIENEISFSNDDLRAQSRRSYRFVVIINASSWVQFLNFFYKHIEVPIYLARVKILYLVYYRKLKHVAAQFCF